MELDELSIKDCLILALRGYHFAIEDGHITRITDKEEENMENMETERLYALKDMPFVANVEPTLQDPVNHPSHYTSGNIEVIEYIEDQKLPYHLGNAVKYISRAGKKDPAKKSEDLEKAIWYIRRYIDTVLNNED